MISWFQSTLPRGERPHLAAHRAVAVAVSIHAPTRGATLWKDWPAFIGSFNPRSHEGSDISRISHSRKSYRFQSTLPRGERQSTEHSPALGELVSIHAPTRGATRCRPPWDNSALCFNPRSHEGSDGGYRQGYRGTVVSIHAPTRGATSSTCSSGR